MNEKEMRAKLEALEAENASLKEQKALSEKLAALEAENAALEADLAGDAADSDAAAEQTAGDAADSDAAAEQTAVTPAVPADNAAEAAQTAEQTAVTQVAPADAATEAAAADAAEPATEVVMVRKGSRTRNLLVGVLVVLSCLSVVVTGVAWWVHYSVFNTNGYIKLVGPIGKDPVAIQSLSEYVAGQVVAATDLQARTAAALPAEAQFLAGPITGAVNKFIAEGTAKVLATPQAYDLWIKINTVAHEQIVALLRGETTYTYIQGNDVKLDTIPLISQVLVWIDGKLPGALGTRFSPPVIPPGTPPDQAIQQVSAWIGRPLPADLGQITLLQNDALGPAQTAVRWFDALVWIVLVVALVLIALTIWLSRRRRRTLIELGIGVAIALILTRVILKQASTALVDSLHGGGAGVLRDVVSASLGPLTNLVIWISVIGVIVAVAAWIAGRHDIQVAVVKAGRRVVQREDVAFAADSPVTAWLERHAPWLRLAGLIVGLIVLVFAASSWLGVLVWVLVILVYEGVISLLIRQWPFGHREKGDETPA